MGTDNWPVDFVYISRRLTTEIVQQDEAARSRWQWSWNVWFKIIGLTVTKRQLDYVNRFDLAKRATEAVTDRTGTFDFGGEYVSGELDLHVCAGPVFMGWEDTISAKIAILVADQVKDGERLFLALFGSIGNYTGHEYTKAIGGWHPSDADGLYRILATSLEPSDPKIEQGRIDDDYGHDALSKVEVAMTFAERVISEHLRSDSSSWRRCTTNFTT